MHMWVHILNLTKAMANLWMGTQVSVVEPIAEPVVILVFDMEEVGPVPEWFEWEPMPVTNEASLGLSTMEADELVGWADTDLSHTQKEQLHSLLLKNGDLFSVKLTPGQALMIPHEINTQGH
ncbi:uncharacterized protein ACA1_337310 [Acanthamoeba castellanii str. Neff]|uniref:Uncharacterized protein n=1 Tax=Acanthamoeba castellanii (strain ATCC 30010 / Neff) TaxID=1257118 RepID=L8HBV0_ACACF|nr:uncharacterized protein ACA1_337310 [Acanthamoeba castellanii str. Neff]ELR21881.1 hypothetical protein ACA1_337310 [Acanthamoeba castellanii str. Neff]